MLPFVYASVVLLVEPFSACCLFEEFRPIVSWKALVQDQPDYFLVVLLNLLLCSLYFL